jgi:hypothetical protein
MPLAISFLLLSLGVLLSTYFFLEQVADITSIILFVTGIHLLAVGAIADLIVKRSEAQRQQVYKTDEDIVDQPTGRERDDSQQCQNSS